jgi:zinc D-Ala-D-Ala dipeptidase
LGIILRTLAIPAKLQDNSMRRLYFWILSTIAMGIVLLSGGCFGPVTSTATPAPPIATGVKSPGNPILKPGLSSDYKLVDIQTIAPDIRLDMRYATVNNFLKAPVYPVARCLLRAPVAQALKAAQADLRAQGLGLKLYDCYRPLSVQSAMWKILPDSRYVANPATGSRHNRGAAVDLTLVDAQGKELEMPTEFDDFSELAGRDSTAMTPAARRNVEILTTAMERQGYTSIVTEWWHYDGPNWQRFGILNKSL